MSQLKIRLFGPYSFLCVVDRVTLEVYSAAHYEVYREQLTKMREGSG